MNWFEQIIKKIEERDNKPFEDNIASLNQMLKVKQSEVKELNKELEQRNLIIKSLNSELDDTKNKLDEIADALDTLTKPTDLDLFCGKNYSEIDMIAYKNKRKTSGIGYSIYLNELIQYDAYEVKKFFKGMPYLTNRLRHAQAIGDKVAKAITWTDDKNLDKSGDYYLYPSETIAAKKGDCFAGYEEIYTIDGTKRIEDVKVNDLVLSYDFNKKEYVYKKVIKHWSKGELEINRVHLRNGQHFDLSEYHPMWVRDFKTGSYKKQELSKINLDSWKDKKVPVTLKIPYTKSKPLFHKDLYRVIGHFLAEGWHSKDRKVGSSGYELVDYIIPLLEKHNVPFSEGHNGNNIPTINFLKSDFKEYLKTLKSNSFDIHIGEDILSLPEEYLEEFMYGVWLGDGTKNTGTGRNSYRWVYSTSSEQFANDIVRIMQQLGRPIHFWKQYNHKGAGKQPIYRLTYNPKSHFLADKGYSGLSETSISRIEKLGKTEMFDLTVEDTHTVILKNGLVTHQCEDHSLIVCSACPEFGWALGFLTVGNNRFGHAFNVFVHNGELYILDTVGNSARIEKAKDNKDYKIHYIVTKKKAYVVEWGASFGELAGWI